MDIEALILISLIFTGLGVMFVLSRIKLPLEARNKPIFQTTCAGQYGIVFYSIPFVRLSLYDDFAVIAYSNKKVLLKYNEVTSVNYKKKFLQKGIVVNHNRKDLQDNIVITALSHKKILCLFKNKGVDIDNHKSNF